MEHDKYDIHGPDPQFTEALFAAGGAPPHFDPDAFVLIKLDLTDEANALVVVVVCRSDGEPMFRIAINSRWGVHGIDVFDDDLDFETAEQERQMLDAVAEFCSRCVPDCYDRDDCVSAVQRERDGLPHPETGGLVS